MQVDTSNSPVTSVQQQRRSQDENVQNLFTEILQNEGRDGFASAEVATPNSTSETTEHRIQQAWQDWFQTERAGRYAGPDITSEMATEYGNVLVRAYNEGGYVAPKEFLHSLEPDELETVQHIQRLAAPIRVDSLDEEGALNLLLPPAAQVDLNRDGLTQSGLAYGIRFPDSTTPKEVVQAWNEATEGMPTSELMLYELRMKLPVLLANIELDANGRFVSQRNPGDPDFVNPMADPNYSFIDVTDDWMEHIEYFKNQIAPDRYAKDMEFWQHFQDRLIATSQ